MRTILLFTLMLAAAASAQQAEDPSDFFNLRFYSPNREFCLVIRRYPELGDFERVTTAAYYKRDEVQDWLDEYPIEPASAGKKPGPTRAALYRRMPSGNHDLLTEIEFRPHEPFDQVMLTDDGHIVTQDSRLPCGAKNIVMTIRAQDGSIVRTISGRDLVTQNDQFWLCGLPSDSVRWSIDDSEGPAKLRVTMFIGDEQSTDAETRYVREIDLATGALPAPDGDHCPSAVRVVAEEDDGRAPYRTASTVGEREAFEADDVAPIASHALLARVIERVTPDYPEVAYKARVSGNVRVEVVVRADGTVEAARIHPLPFGIDKAVEAAIVHWKFAPDATRVSGSFVFRFEIVRPLTLTTTSISQGSVARPEFHRASASAHRSR
jgi:TonB family protein